jgi:hypothetical protein
MFTATEPARTRALILFATSARFLFADDYPWGVSEEALNEGLSHCLVPDDGLLPIAS